MRGSYDIPVFLSLLAFLAAPLPLAAEEATQADAVLELATSAGDWLIAQGVPQPTGTAWPADANRPDQVAYNLGSGVAGHVVYFLGLYRATGEERFLQQAKAGASYLAWLIEDESRLDEGPRRASLYAGIAGVGVALVLVSEHAPEFATATDRVVELLDAWDTREGIGVRWSDEFNDLLYGDAGTVLFLAFKAARDGDDRALKLAADGSRLLASRAELASDGHYWRFRRSKAFNLPGFSHGTAGITFVIGTVGVLIQDDILTATAADGFNYLRSLAIVENGSVRFPYGWPLESWDGLFEFGWAHGLAGYGALFTQLQQLDINAADAADYRALVLATLGRIGLPDEPRSPFSEPSTPFDLRFGRAGVLALASADARLGEVLWQYLKRSATSSDGTTYWEIDAPDFMGGGRAAYTGILHGAAGIGLALLRLHATFSERPPYISLPDDPAAWRPSRSAMPGANR